MKLEWKKSFLIEIKIKTDRKNLNNVHKAERVSIFPYVRFHAHSFALNLTPVIYV